MTPTFKANEGKDTTWDSDGKGELRLAGIQFKGVSDVNKSELKAGGVASSNRRQCA